ncbi:GAF and ANTAR domain-containing protein [Aeromicrobium sp. CFBP 8757]|nr:GAF and ANTAR domain-containing protein [Aeromicrobium sp. CFBP 8757]
MSSQKLASVFVEMADTLVDDFDLVDFLHNLTGHATEIADAMAAGILLADHRGLLRFMAASSDQSQIVELLQIQNSEGPCLDCYRTGTPVINTDLRAAGDRWPVFAPTASRAGFGSVHALPMRLRDQVIGTLNIFGAEGARLDASDVAVVQALADVATIAILQERSVRRAETLTEQLHGALNSRVAIEQAKGALSKMLGVDTDRAFTLMRTHARSRRLRLEDVAQTVLDDPRSIPELTTPS